MPGPLVGASSANGSHLIRSGITSNGSKRRAGSVEPESFLRIRLAIRSSFRRLVRRLRSCASTASDLSCPLATASRKRNQATGRRLSSQYPPGWHLRARARLPVWVSRQVTAANVATRASDPRAPDSFTVVQTRRTVQLSRSRPSLTASEPDPDSPAGARRPMTITCD